MDQTIYLGKVYIIEWLAPGDAKTGWELFDELQPIGLMSKPSVEVCFKRVRTRDEFIAYIRTIPEDFRATGRLPLLHIEAHGFIDGICSTAGDEVVWPELMEELIGATLKLAADRRWTRGSLGRCGRRHQRRRDAQRYSSSATRTPGRCTQVDGAG